MQSQEPLGRTGRPAGRTETLTGFRLVRFKEGSGHAALEPVEQYPGEAKIGVPAPTRNLQTLMKAAAEGQALPPVVIDALSQARRSIGDDGSFGVVIRSQPNR